MADITQLGPGASPQPTVQAFDGEILDSVAELGEEVRCVRPELDPNAATDPMPWNPISLPAGFFYPKQGDRAVFVYPDGGPPVILEFFPRSDVPDVPLP